MRKSVVFVECEMGNECDEGICQLFEKVKF